MKIAVLKENGAGETRVAATPESVKKLIALGCELVVEKGAGTKSNFADSAYKDAGATIAATAADAVKGAATVLKVGRPEADELALFGKDQVLVANLGILGNKDAVAELAKTGVTSVAMEMMPRITRAQSMDILSSQSNLAGYKAVVDAAAEFGRAMPMMMTAAGTIPPARVLVFGAGVAGLQAIATAKRMGAIVMATDVRFAAKEQVESLGGKFIVVDEEAMKAAETEGGYAREMSDDFKKKQAEAVRAELVKADIAITTALIPGRKAPVLITADMVKDMKSGSVIVDLAAVQGGNVEGSVAGKTVTKGGVKIIGPDNMAGRLAQDASALLARNYVNFLTAFFDKETKQLTLDPEDDIVKGTVATKGGEVVHPALNG